MPCAILFCLQALSKTLTIDELFYLKEQFSLLGPSKSGSISLDNIRTVSVSFTYFDQIACLMFKNILLYFILSRL